MAGETLSEKYAKQMQKLDIGYGLRTPHPYADLHPGVCGYLDEFKQWNTILDLSTPQDPKVGLTAYPELGSPQSSKEKWDLQVSNRVSRQTVQFGAGISAASLGLPVGVKSAVRFSSVPGFGAIVMSDTEVSRDYYPHQSRFATWLRHNVIRLQELYPDIEEFGLYMVTRTYSSTDIHIAVWNDKTHSVYLGLEIDVLGQATLDSSIDKHRSEYSEDWKDFNEEDDTGVEQETNGIIPQLHGNKVNKVMFFSGVHMQLKKSIPTRKLRWEEIPRGKWRGDNSDSFQVPLRLDEEGHVLELYDVSVEEIGTLDD